MEVETIDLKTFNRWFDTDVKEGAVFVEVLEALDKADADYFYISLNSNDVIEAINNEERAEDVTPYLVEGIGIVIGKFNI